MPFSQLSLTILTARLLQETEGQPSFPEDVSGIYLRGNQPGEE